ncbi:MAG: beta-propeller domain-containing protein [Kofleriaceae bacterium]
MTLRLRLALAAGLASSLLSAPVGAQQPAPGPLVMASTKTCDGLKELMVDTLVYQMLVGYNHYGYGGRFGGRTFDLDQTTNAPTVTAAGGAAPESGPSHHTTTNVQERGVDEADIVKTDGKFVYTVHDNQLVIARTWPVAQTDVVARVTFKTLQPQQLYLRGNEVIVQGTATDALDGWNQGRTRVLVVDVTNRKAPRIKRMLDVEGWSASSRVVGDDLYMVQNNYAQLPPRLQQIAQKAIANVPRADQQTLRPWEIQARLAATMRRSLLASVTHADLTSALPRVRSNGTTRQLACEDLYLPSATNQVGMTTLAKISLTTNAVDLVGAMVSGGTVYSSTDAMYVAAPDYTWNYQGAASYGTQVHKFSLGSKQARPSYVATGRVEGQLLNQFSMSEHQGNLRIATTDWAWNGEQGGNHLFVMRPSGRELRTIGALKGLAKGERIYSGRMVGDKGYLVTFRQTDPLFTLDLSEPTRPRVAGEIKVNGFSSYIHPIGNDLLLTIGQDADDAGRVTGVHLQIFDVKDPAHPTRKFHEKVATRSTYSWSSAQDDHHAFMFDPITNTLAFPMAEQRGSSSFNGLAVYRVDPKHGFQRKGRIDHRTLADPVIAKQCADQKSSNPANAQYYCTETYRNQARMGFGISRSMVVDKYILSLSPVGLEIHALAGLEVAATLGWTKVEATSAIAVQ